jgi:hypothetical protein
VELVEQVNALLRQTQRNELAIARTRIEARKLLATDPVAAHELLGMLAALEFDQDAMRQEFDAALRIAPKDSRLLLNFAISLQRLGFDREGRAMAEKTYQLKRGSLAALDEVIRQCFLSCRVDLALDWLQERQSKAQAKQHPMEADILALHRLFKSRRVRPERVERMLEQVVELLRARSIFAVRRTVAISSDEEDTWLSVQLEIDEPVETIVGLNCLLADMLAVAGSRNRSSGPVSFTYVPAA